MEALSIQRWRDAEVQAVLALLHGAWELACLRKLPPEMVPITMERWPSGIIPVALLAQLAERDLVVQGEQGYWLTEEGYQEYQQSAREPTHEDGAGLVEEYEPKVPRWDRRDGKWWLGDVLLKSVPKWATNERKLLDGWQADGWAGEVGNPFTTGKLPNVRRLRDTLRSLKTANVLKYLTFSVGRGGRVVSWKLIPDL